MSDAEIVERVLTEHCEWGRFNCNCAEFFGTSGFAAHQADAVVAALASTGRVAELERMLEHEVERYLKQLHLRERAEHTAAQSQRQLEASIRGNAKLLAQLKAQGAALRAAGIEDRPINFPNDESRLHGEALLEPEEKREH